jgi:hypothetical protein
MKSLTKDITSHCTSWPKRCQPQKALQIILNSLNSLWTSLLQAPRDFLKAYKVGNVPVADALIPANLPPDALEIIGRGLRYLGAEDDDFSGIHFAYASGQIPGNNLLP